MAAIPVRSLAHPIPVARPRLPRAGALMPYLQQIDASGWYANGGPLVQVLQRRLARHWGLEAREVALLSSGTSALLLALLALLACAVPRGKRCLMPSWTFAASAGAVRQAGLVPHFMDVRPETWVPDPAVTLDLASRHDVGAILVVSPFGAPLDGAAWDGVRRETGLPVVIDAAAAFDTLRKDGPMALGDCPAIVSLHATKAFGIGEGGAVLSRDQAFMERVRRLAQFGFMGTREAVLPGVNAKLSEYAAAVGLAGLDEWPATRDRWLRAARRYAALLPPHIPAMPGFGLGWVGSCLDVLVPGELADVEAALAQDGVGTVRWWGPGCHAQPAFRDCPAEPLPVTEALARRVVGVPFWQDLPARDIATVCSALARAARPRRAARHPALMAA